MKRTGVRLASSVACALALALTACATPGPAAPSADSSSPDPSPSSPGTDPQPAAPTVSGLQLGDRDWLYSPGGVELPLSVTLTSGAATIDGVTYSLGETVFSDANGDGTPDVAAQINRADGNGYEILWYIWVVDTAVADGAAAATQVPYPISRAARCGSTINRVQADPAGFLVNESIRLPFTDDDLPCSKPGTGVSERTIALTTDDNGGYFPIQIGPLPEWGGICPGSPWLDGIEETAELRSAPVASAPIAVSADTSIGVYELNPAPQLEAFRASGWTPVGFSVNDDTGDVRLHCAFFAQPAG